MRSFFTKIKSSVSLTLIFIFITLLVCDYNFRWKNEQWKSAVNTDAYYYYHYLPSIFINHDLGQKNKIVYPIKYYIGTAIFELPFFALACFFSFLFHLPVDGYSLLFPVFISLAFLFYLLCGLYFFAKFLKYFSFPDWLRCLIIFSLAFGTNIFYYTVIDPGWSHIIGFGIICFLLYHIKKLFVEFNLLSLFLIVSSAGFLFLVRPTNMLIFLIAPFLAENKTNLISTFKKIISNKKTIACALGVTLIPLLCQLIIYKISTGNFIYWAYTKEGFNFLKPEIVNVLFSYTKGIFVYVPLCFLSLFGFIKLFRTNRFLFWGTLFYLSLIIYFLSCWWCWHFGWSYGPRGYIEQLPIFFFLLSILVGALKSVSRKIILVFIFFFVFLNLFQTYQASTGILDRDYKTDSKGYWHTFLKTDAGYSGKYFRFPVDESKSNIKNKLIFINDLEHTDTTWINTDTRTNEQSHSGMYSSKVNKNQNYSIGLKKKLSDVFYKRNVLIRASAWFYITKKNSESFFTISFVNNGTLINYNPFKLDGYIDSYGKWEELTFEMYMPKLSPKDEKEKNLKLEFYTYNNSDINCFVDDLKIEFTEYKKLERVLDIDWER